MIRKDTDRPSTGGRRPLLLTFVGNNRHMLNEIRDSLSHLRKNDLEGYEDFPSLHLRPELSQSTPNILEKSAGCKMTRRDNQHHKALAEIRDSLRPYQTTNSVGSSSGGSSSDNSSSASSTSSHATSDAENNASKVQTIMQYGFDEDIAVRALQLSGNQSVNSALRLLLYILEERLGGALKGVDLPVLSFHQSSNYGPSSPFSSETNSVRSDSPTLSSTPQRHLLVNGLQTPPPLPPRVPIATQASHASYNQTPPTFADGATNGSSLTQQHLQGQSSALLLTLNQAKAQSSNAAQAGMLVHSQNNVIPQGHVQQMIKRMSPGQTYHMQQKQQQMQANGGAMNSITQRVISPAAAGNPQQSCLMGANGNGGGLGPSPLLNQQLQNMMLGSLNGTSLIPMNSATTLPPGHSQAPPPPYNQARLQVAMVKGFSGGVPTSAHMEHLHQQDLHRVSPVMDVPAKGGNPEVTQIMQKKIVSSAAVPATRMAIGLHMPVIMPSVRSKEVTKPVPQTATAPLAPPIHSLNMSNHNPPQLKSHINNMSSLPSQHPHKHNPQTLAIGQPLGVAPPGRDFQVPMTHSHKHVPQGIWSGGNYLHEQLSGIIGGPSLVQPHQPNPFFQNHTQKLHNTTLYQQYPPDLATSRSDSPVSRTTAHSPMSVPSTTSSPSTFSDMLDKPPPPYSRQTVLGLGMGLSPHANPPLLPPRVPLKDKPLNDHEQSPHFGVSAQISNCTQPSIMSSAALPTPSSSSLPLMKMGLISLPNGAIPLHSNMKEPLPHTDNSNTTYSQPELIIQQVVGSASPSETDDIDPDMNPGHNSCSSTKCSSRIAQEKHRCLSPLPERKSEARERDMLRCDTKVRVYSPQAFKFYMEQHVENVLKSHAQRMNRRLQLEKEMAKVKLSEEAAQQMRKMLHQKESNYIRLKRAKMESSMFEKIQTLGVGAFGEVSLVRKKDVGSLYAMKILKKSNVIKRNQVAHVKAERDILAEADNEWVVKLYYSFQDRDSLYFVMDYVPGGDLMGLLIRKEILEEHLAQFYIAELVLAIESVHKMGFIHRDIKPDNILIDKDGHIKLTDFGLCTGFRWTHNSKYYQNDGLHARQDSMDVSIQLDDQYSGEVLKPLEQRRRREQKRYLAHSLVGTPNYIAPEVLLRQGYTKACDWWSVGVILYEMVIGQPPFYALSPAETQYKVINWKETLSIRHCTNISLAATDLIIRLLQGPEARLGQNGAPEVKDHPFFSGINFQGLRRQPAPLKPTIRYLTDTSNFDPVDPDKLRTNDSEGSRKVDSKLENGKHPEHAFFEFTFRRFFDDGGHPCSVPPQQDHESNSPVYV